MSLYENIEYELSRIEIEHEYLKSDYAELRSEVERLRKENNIIGCIIFTVVIIASVSIIGSLN